MKTQDEEQADHPIEWWASIASSMTDLRSVETMLKASSLEGRRLFAVQALATARFCIATIRDAIRTLLKGIDLRTLPNKEPRGSVCFFNRCHPEARHSCLASAPETPRHASAPIFPSSCHKEGPECPQYAAPDASLISHTTSRLKRS